MITKTLMVMIIIMIMMTISNTKYVPSTQRLQE